MNRSLLEKLSAVIAGLLFGAGLALSGMNNTAKVQGFLDITGNWDISLAFVMIGALAVALTAFPFIFRKQCPIVGEKFHLPEFKAIDKRLLIGAAIFGVGWGLIGYCPGPAVAAISYGYWQTYVFIASMLAGAFIAREVL